MYWIMRVPVLHGFVRFTWLEKKEKLNLDVVLAYRENKNKKALQKTSLEHV